MNTLSNKVSVSGYMSKRVTENNKTLLTIPCLTKCGIVNCKVLCDSKMLTDINVSETTKILVSGEMVSGLIYASNITILN